jgi:hypothetical protein
MRAEFETIHASRPDKQSQSVPRDEWAQVHDSLEQTRSDLRRTRTEIRDYQEEAESRARRARILWALAALLVCSVGLLTWFGIPLMKEHKGFLTQIPALQTAIDGFSTRMASVESRLNLWADDRTAVANRLSNIEKAVKTNLGVAQNAAQNLARNVKTEVGQTLQAVQNRLNGVESAQRNTSDEVARLQNELSTVRAQLDDLRKDNAQQMTQVQQQFQQAQQSAQSDVSRLDRQLVSNQTRLDSLSYQADRQRVDFELRKGRTEQVSPNIFLTIKDADVARQRINGWLQIANDGRIVWLRDQSMQHPVAFASRQDERSYQLVFTQIQNTSVAGYLLVPTQQEGN